MIQQTFVAFVGDREIVRGSRDEVVVHLRSKLPSSPPLIFGLSDGKQVDFDLSTDIESPPAPTAGRPKLGVVAREVTLLPRQWEWIESQPGGASAVLRRIVDDAKRRADSKHAFRDAADAACRFMSAMAGNMPGYEAATRALYGKDPVVFQASTLNWPSDIRSVALHFAEQAFELIPG